MAIPVFCIGRSGSGKTYSIKNFKADEVGVISVEKGRLPFKTDIKTVRIPKDFSTANTSAQLNAAGLLERASLGVEFARQNRAVA